MTDVELIEGFAKIFAEHARDKESTAGMIDFFDKLFKERLNCPYQKGDWVLYYSRGIDIKNPKWRPAIVTGHKGHGSWNNNTPNEIHILLIDSKSTREIRKEHWDFRLKKYGKTT